MTRLILSVIAVLQLALLSSARSDLPVAPGLQAGLTTVPTASSLNTSALSTCSYKATCTVSGIEGVCVSISEGCCSGAVASNLCPGDSDIKCCTNNPCSTPSGSGTCMQTSACSGTSVAGYCSGPSDVQCCVGSAPTCSTPSGSGTCKSTSDCAGTSVPGYCDGPSDVQCCIDTPASSCTTPYGSGTCMDTSSCSKNSVPGYCDGPSNIQCCIDNAPTPDAATSGIDLSTAMSASAGSCLAGSFSFIIPRGFMSVGRVDDSVCTTLNSALSAGFKTRDVYIFPCPTCSSSANSQMADLVSYLKSNCASAWSGRVWLDIEGTQYWLGNTASNQAWYQQLVDSCSANGVPCGVYSSNSQWSALFGSSSYSYGSELPLWYAHYDYYPSFGDFSPFGGWTSPHAKQYSGTSYSCDMGIDTNYSPSF